MMLIRTAPSSLANQKKRFDCSLCLGSTNMSDVWQSVRSWLVDASTSLVGNQQEGRLI